MIFWNLLGSNYIETKNRSHWLLCNFRLKEREDTIEKLQEELKDKKEELNKLENVLQQQKEKNNVNISTCILHVF